MKNYFPSWIANLGVVPLLLFAAFLFLPEPLFLFALLAFVTLVLETISQFLFNRSQGRLLKISKIIYLPISTYNVKKYIILYGALFTIIQSTYAVMAPQNILLSRGEHRELPFNRPFKFTIGNKDIISHKLNKRSLLIKGKKIGFTEVITWSKKGQKNLYRVYVLSKIQQLKILHLAQTIEFMNLQTHLAGTMLIVEGKLKSLQDFKLLLNLKVKYPNDLHLKVELEKGLRNKIIGEVYSYLFLEGVEEISCKNHFLTFQCHYHHKTPPSKESKRFIKKNFNAILIPAKNYYEEKNFIAKLKLIQMENESGKEFSLGLDQLNGSISSIFSTGLKGLIEQNKIILNNNDLSISTLAEPQTVLRFDKEAIIQVGAEVPYKTHTGGNELKTEWFFSGLKIKIKIKKIGGRMDLQYKTEFTRPSNTGAIAGSKEASTAIIELNKPLKLFQIGYQSIGENESSFPLISKIPILGRLFTATSKKKVFKNISGYIVIEEHSYEK